MEKFIIICSTCRVTCDNDLTPKNAGSEQETAAELLAADLKLFAPEWSIQLHPCLSMCKNPISLAIQAQYKATYLFSGLKYKNLGDIKTFLTLYDQTSNGWIEDARPLGALRYCLTGRIPATQQSNSSRLHDQRN